ncbi:NAD-dependent epimerase/dehydratase family protein [Mumia quercus]|uniref:NAD-dependent epimerase/dehydratase family protein n=1 Tax=Mumia quercus TaxID=2976125 RepID=UPI0021D016C8|nr:NAD-dependent epimerase/dehydratase family protein [Mumia quercus]
MPEAPVTWVVGASGLLGGHVCRAAGGRGHRVQRVAIPWGGDVDQVRAAFREGVRSMVASAGGGSWNVVWTAGAAVVGTSAADVDAEVTAYAALLEELRPALADGGTGRGAMFVASSAGAVYAGASGAPFTEGSPVRALAPYGFGKLAIEELTGRACAEDGLRAMVGRIANLYGPGQDLGKQQGLVSQLARSYLRREPLPLYVSLDTARDYLYVGDCADVVVRAVEATVRDTEPGTSTVKILASGRPTTIGALLGEFNRIVRRRVPFVTASSPGARFQVRDLRMRSTVARELDRQIRTPLPVGIAATVADVAQRMRAGLTAPGTRV